MKQYLDLLKECLEEGIRKGPSREGQCGTIELFGRQMRFDMDDGFPAVTTKKLFFRGVVEELLWMLNGGTNASALASKGVHIWDADAYNYYKRVAANPLLSREDFREIISSEQTCCGQHRYKVAYKNGESHPLGDLGSIYGKQIRRFGDNQVDQLKMVINELKKNPDSRRAVVSHWDAGTCWDNEQTALPACHAMWQLLVSNGRLNLMVYQRSADLFLGVPFDIALYALLLHILSSILDLTPGELVWVGSSVHIYEEHIDAVKEQLTKKPLPPPEIWIKKSPTVENLFDASNYSLVNYKSHGAIKADLIAGN